MPLADHGSDQVKLNAQLQLNFISMVRRSDRMCTGIRNVYLYLQVLRARICALWII